MSQVTQRLEVYRTFSTGESCQVGLLAQNRQGVFFQYADDYLAHHANLSPFGLSFNGAVQLAPPEPHGGLHGLFADSLPDGWGLLLMDRLFRQAGIAPNRITPMDRLAFVGDRAIGALSYRPVSALQPQQTGALQRISTLGTQAQALYAGQTSEILAELTRVGSSGGARPKAQLYLAGHDNDQCSSQPAPGLSPYLVKFTAQRLPLGHEEGLCEAAYLTLAQRAGIETPAWRLVSAPTASGATRWLALQRFDTTAEGGRLHMHSAGGLLDADFRLPSLDYADLIKASSLLTHSPAAGQAQFRRALFNLFALNQDDHSKNWAFLQNDQGEWRLAPFYDVTFSPGPYGEHTTAFAGFGKTPSRKAMQQLAAHANYASWAKAKQVIDEVLNALADWASVARQLGISNATSRLIGRQMDQVYREQLFLS